MATSTSMDGKLRHPTGDQVAVRKIVPFIEVCGLWHAERSGDVGPVHVQVGICHDQGRPEHVCLSQERLVRRRLGGSKMNVCGYLP